MRCGAGLGWLRERKKPPTAPISGLLWGALYCLCAVVGREGVTLGHKGADTAFHLSGGARMPLGLWVGTNALKRADAGFS